MVRFNENIPDDKLIGGMGKGTICEDVNFRLDLQRVREPYLPYEGARLY